MGHSTALSEGGLQQKLFLILPGKVWGGKIELAIMPDTIAANQTVLALPREAHLTWKR